MFCNITFFYFFFLLIVIHAIVAPANSPDDLFIFIDNSNLFIQARKSISSPRLHIDYGRLLKTIKGRRNLGQSPLLVGSIPPYDSLWRHIRGHDYVVTLFERDNSNHEKEVDTEIAVQMTNTVCRKIPATLAVVTGDRNFYSPIKVALKERWKVELWYWESGMESPFWKKKSILFEKSVLSLIKNLLSEKKSVPLV